MLAAKVVIIDNYDSFTYNIVELVHRITTKRPVVYLNNKIDFAALQEATHIIISPGPGLPYEAGHMPTVIRDFSTSKAMLGICLGHQAIAEHFGGTLFNLNKPYHGVKTKIQICMSDQIFCGMPKKFYAGLYHSWGVEQPLPAALLLLAKSSTGITMVMKHKELPVYGVQYHPESILTQYGDILIRNFIEGTCIKY